MKTLFAGLYLTPRADWEVDSRDGFLWFGVLFSEATDLVSLLVRKNRIWDDVSN